MPALDITWYDGIDNQPELPEGYGVSEYNADIPLVGNQKLQASKLNPGKIIYSKEFTFKGGSHGSTLSIIGDKEKTSSIRKFQPARPITLKISSVPAKEKKRHVHPSKCPDH